MPAPSTDGGAPDRRTVLLATVTPLASIFGSGFLIIVPVLERALGAYAIVGVVAVSILAYLIGNSVRHNVRVSERLEEAGELDPTTRRLERIGDLVIVVAYVISVTLYIRILSQYVLDYAGTDSLLAQQVMTSLVIAFIATVGITRGFGGLSLLERISLGTALVLVIVLIGDLLKVDVVDLTRGDFSFPPSANRPITETLQVLGGILIAFQGFETVRYIGTHYDRRTRIAASALSQRIALPIYVAFIAVATPLMALGSAGGPDETLLDLVERVTVFLALPLVLSAALTQFSAATADVVAAVGNLRVLASRRMAGVAAYLVSCGGAIAMAWVNDLFVIIVIASRAFAAYYMLQAVVSMRTCETRAGRVGYGAMALTLAAIVVLAQPVG